MIFDPITQQHPDPVHINARLNAKAAGEHLYIGRTCRDDGSTLRYVSDDFCVVCAKRMRTREFSINANV